MAEFIEYVLTNEMDKIITTLVVVAIMVISTIESGCRNE
jgi:hypothetical protein